MMILDFIYFWQIIAYAVRVAAAAASAFVWLAATRLSDRRYRIVRQAATALGRADKVAGVVYRLEEVTALYLELLS
ncbi:hypothetical protein RE9425_03490 [Prescottella equi]|nr:hypothetical protein RE9425_03490 [Prescottella equi]